MTQGTDLAVIDRGHLDAGALVAVDPDLTVTTQHIRLLTNAADGRNDILSKIPDEETLATIRKELQAALDARAIEAYASKCSFTLVACYPHKGNRSSEEMAAYLSIMVEELQRFPSDIVRDAVLHLRRTSKFLPSVAEVVTACEELQGQRRALLRGCARLSAFGVQKWAY